MAERETFGHFLFLPQPSIANFFVGATLYGESDRVSFSPSPNLVVFSDGSLCLASQQCEAAFLFVYYRVKLVKKGDSM